MKETKEELFYKMYEKIVGEEKQKDEECKRIAFYFFELGLTLDKKNSFRNS